MRKWLIILIALLVSVPVIDGRRTSKTVQNERNAASAKIKKTKQQLSKNEEETRRELLNLQTIEGEIRESESETARLTEQSNALRSHRRRLSDSIADNEKRLTSLKDSYAKALRAARRQRKIASDAVFIFSSENFHQARSRARWLDELNSWQSRKAQEIKETKTQLETSRQRLDTLAVKLQSSLDSLSVEQRLLSERKHQADAVVGSLKRQSRNLTRVLNEQQRLAEQLDRELNRIIEEEARRAAEEARKAEEARRKKEQQNKDKSTATKVEEPAPKVDKIEPIEVQGKSFAQNKGRLPWPLDKKAVISSTFGRHQHKTYSKVTTQNNGIDFDTSVGASARAVFPGIVTATVVLSGYHNVVLVRHGEYITVYAGIDELKVRKGQSVAAGDILGTIYSDPKDGNRTRLHFEVRHEKEKLDPCEWIKQ